MPHFNKVEDINLIKNKSMKLRDLFLAIKQDCQKIEIDIEGGATVYNEVKTANLGVTDPAELITNAAKVIIANQSKLPISWQGDNLENAIIKFLIKIENGVTATEIEAIVKGIIAAPAVTATAK